MHSRPALVLGWFIFLALACTMPTTSLSIPVTVTATVETMAGCFYVEASSALPESEAAVRMAVEAAGAAVHDVTVWGQGEDYKCTDANTSQFSARASFVTITIQVEDLNDIENLGNTAAEILDALKGLTYEQLPHWSSGDVTLIATAQGDQI